MSCETFYERMRREVGRQTGLDRDPTNWSSYSVADVNDLIQSAYQKVLRPPVLQGERVAHQWSWLNPAAVLQLQANVDDYAMPEDFAGLIGDITFHSSNNTLSETITQVPESHMYTLRSHDDYRTTSSDPQYVAMRIDKQVGGGPQKYIAMVWPTPNSAYTVRYRYYTRDTNGMTADHPSPPGGPENEELFRSAIYAEVELHLEDFHGPQYQNFLEQLRASVSRDRTANSPDNLGYNGDGSFDPIAIAPRSTPLTTYAKYPV